MEFLAPVIQLLIIVLDIFIYMLIAQVVLSWLVAFNVVNTSNQIVHMIGTFLYRVTEPVLGPVRRFLPSLGPVDISPVVVFLAVWFVKAELIILVRSLH